MKKEIHICIFLLIYYSASFGQCVKPSVKPVLNIDPNGTISFCVTGSNHFIPYTNPVGEPDQFILSASNGGYKPVLNWTTLPAQGIPIGDALSVNTAAGFYSATLYVRNSITQCQSDPIALTYYAMRPFSFFYEDASFCINQQNPLYTWDYIEGSPNLYEIHWDTNALAAGLQDVPLTVTPSVGDGNIPIANLPAKSGKYYGTLTTKSRNLPGCTNSYGISINVKGPYIKLENSTIEICQGSTTASFKVLEAIFSSEQPGGALYNWTLDWDNAANQAGLTDVVSVNQSSALYEFPFSGSAFIPGTYNAKIFVYDVRARCETIIPVTMNVTAQTPIVTTSSKTICSGESTNLELTSTVPGVSFFWEVSTLQGGQTISGEVPSGEGNSIQHTLINSSIHSDYIVYRVYPKTCRKNLKDITVHVNGLITSGAIGSNQIICSGGDPGQFTETTPSTGLLNGYQWKKSLDNINFSEIAGATSNIYNVPPGLSQQTYYKRVALATNAGRMCSAESNTINVDVKTVPVASAPNQVICTGGTTGVQLSSTLPATTFSWATPAMVNVIGGSSGSGSSIVQTLINSTSNWGTATYIAVPFANGCAGIPANVTISVGPTISITGPSSFCESTTLTANPVGGTYLWSNGKTTRSITVNSSGAYSVTVTTEQCAGTTSIATTRKPASAYISPSGSNICNGITLTSSYGTSYRWSTGERTQSIVVRSNGTYSVTVTLTNGCTAFASHTISSNSGPGISMVQPYIADPCPTATSSGKSSEKIIHVLPNPASENLTVQRTGSVDKELPLFIMNNTGQTVLASSFREGETSRTIDTRTYANGIYYVRAGSSFEKVIIQH